MRRCPRLLLLALAAALLAAAAPPAVARSLRQFPDFSGSIGASASPTLGSASPAPQSSPSFGGGGGGTTVGTTQDSCFSGFASWLSFAETCTGTVQQCCAPLLNLGGVCWGSIIDSAASNATVLNATISLFESCGLTVTPPANGPAPPPETTLLDEQLCIDNFNLALNSTCGNSSDFAGCCNSLSALGGQCLVYLAATLAADPQYATLSTAFTGTLDSCRILLNTSTTPSPSPGLSPGASPAPIGGSGPSPSDQLCTDGFLNVIDTTCGQFGTQAACCSSLDNLGQSCLALVANILAQNQTLFQQFASLLQGCGYTITSSSSTPGARSAAAATNLDVETAKACAQTVRSAVGAAPTCALCGVEGQVAGAAKRRSALEAKHREFDHRELAGELSTLARHF